MKPQFSIIIPVYNAEQTLLKALESIESQSYRNFEVIVINDGSTDHSAAIIQGWKDVNPEIELELIHQKNGGLGNARNTGILKANHSWTAFLDADDFWESNKLEIVADAIQNNVADLYYHPVISFGLNSSRQRSCWTVKSLEDLLIKGNPILPSAVVGKTYLIRKHLFSENPEFHGAEDLYLWICLISENHILEKLDMPLTHYRETGGMSTNINRHLNNVIGVLEHFHNKRYFDNDLFEKAKRRKYLEVARFFHKRKLLAEANDYYQKSGSNHPKVIALRFLRFLGFAI